MGAQCQNLSEPSRNMPTTEHAADVTNNHCHRSTQSNHTSRKHRRTYPILHPNSNVIVISAALVLLLNSPCARLSIGGTTRWNAQAFDPYLPTPSLFRYGTTTSSSCFRPSTRPSTTDTTSHYVSIGFFSSLPTTTHDFSIPRRRTLSHRLHSTEKSKSSISSSSWSKAAMSTTTSTDESSTTTQKNKTTRRESRIGVRRRVKSVLKKASRRTGIRNNSDDDVTPPPSTTWDVPKQPAASIVADAASIGGLGAVIVDEETGQVDVAFDYIPSRSTDKDDDEEEDSTNTEPWGTSINGSGVTSSTTKDANGSTTTISTRRKKPTKKKKTPPASTYSPPIGKLEPCPEDSLVVASPTTKSTITSTTTTPSSTTCDEMDVFKSDVSAAFSLPPPPLPFTLPKLSPSQKALLKSGERVQFQSEMGREGSGFVVLDVQAPLSVVWNCLLDFQSYPETISGVKNVQMDAVGGGNLDYGKSGTSQATFTLSRKFGLRVSVVHKYKTHPLGDHMIFELDEKNRNFVLNKAKGVWFTETEGEGLEPGSTRIWLLAELKVSSLLPRFIVDYAAKKAFPKATNWIKPHVETAASLWLRPDKKEE